MAAPSRKKKNRARAATARTSGNPAKAGAPARGAHTSGNPAHVDKATIGDWIGAARPRTLPLAITPVLIGTGAALTITDAFHWVIALCCLVVAVALQVGVNYANDYSDGIRGTDDYRIGPARLTAARKASPKTVRAVALTFFAIAAIAGVAIVIRTGHWWMLLVGAACIIAAWFYTGGKRPYGYAGLGELFVFVFFGLVATAGTTFVQAGAVPGEAWIGAVIAGLFACAVLLVNNLRDIDQDRAAGKHTLTVRIGKTATRVLYTLLIVVAMLLVAGLALLYPLAWLAMLALIPAAAAILIVWTYRDPRELVVTLALSSLTSLAVGAFLLWAFVG